MSNELLYTAINAVMKEVGYVQKSGTNREQNYKFAGEAMILAALRPELVKQGLMIIPLRPENRTYTSYPSKSGALMHRTVVDMHYRIAHTSGEYLDVAIPGVGVDSGDKDMNKALTVAYKYVWRQTFGIETGDDPDKESPEEAAHPAATRKPAPRKVDKLQPEQPADTDVPAPQAARSDLMLVTVEAVSAKPTTNGKARYAFKIAETGQWAGCFDTGMCERNLGDPKAFKGAAMAHIFQNGDFWNLDWIERASAKPASTVADEYEIGDLGPPLNMDDPTDPFYKETTKLPPLSPGQ